MTRLILSSILLAVSTAGAQDMPPTTPPGATKSKTISIQEMLVIGHSGMKLHALAMITQDNVEGGVDDSFLPGFKVCTEDTATPVRSVTARLLGIHFVQDQEQPNPEAMELLLKLARDESSDVRFSAIYHGLTRVENKSEELIEQLIEMAAENRDQALYERIAESLQDERDTVTDILNQKLKAGNDIAYFEIYEDLSGQKPPQAEQYLEQPSSRPRLFIFKADDAEPQTAKAELISILQQNGLENPDVQISGTDNNHVLMVKTYITKDYKTIEKAFKDHNRFRITQELWLTPELEIQIEAMQKH